jgi:reactive intermediate/imine deaminase
MSRTVVIAPDAPQPKASYSQGMLAGGLLFTAGTGPHDPRTGEVVDGDVEQQTRATLRNVERILEAAGLGLADIVKVTVHLGDLRRDFPAFDRTYRELMPAPHPPRTTVGSTLWDILVEIDVVAQHPAGSAGSAEIGRQ